MRRTLAAILIILLFAPELHARGNQGWDDVKKLKQGTFVEIVLWNGDYLRGDVESVSDAKLRIATTDPSAAQTNWLRDLDRTDVRKIVRSRDTQPHDPRRWMIAGAVAGSAVGIGIGAHTDINQHQNYHWFEGALAGALLGFVGGLAALAVADTAQLAHRHQVVYQDNRNQGSR